MGVIEAIYRDYIGTYWGITPHYGNQVETIWEINGNYYLEFGV